MSSCIARRLFCTRHISIATPLCHTAILQPYFTENTYTATQKRYYSKSIEKSASKSEEYWIDSLFKRDTANLLKDEKFYNYPVIMIHAQWSDTAVSVHTCDKLDELDAVYAVFANDIGFYGLYNRIREECTKELVRQALNYMKKHKMMTARVVHKGWNIQLHAALACLDDATQFNFISLTDMSRRLGEENPVYQRPVKCYPNKVKSTDLPLEGPDNLPSSKIDKFTRLNVFWRDMAAVGHNTPELISQGKRRRANDEDERPATRKGYKKKSRSARLEIVKPIIINSFGKTDA